MNAKIKATWGLAVLAVAFAVAVLFTFAPERGVYAQGAGVLADFTTTGDTTPITTPGFVYKQASTGITYEYVYFDNGAGNIAVTAGDPAYVKTLATYQVTSDISDAITGTANSVCGIFVSSVTDARYCWIQVYGPYATVTMNTDDDASPGDTIIADADAVCNTVASGTASTHRALGYGTGSCVDGDNTVAAWITVGPF